jgi:hypothetical protein
LDVSVFKRVGGCDRLSKRMISEGGEARANAAGDRTAPTCTGASAAGGAPPRARPPPVRACRPIPAATRQDLAQGRGPRRPAAAPRSRPRPARSSRRARPAPLPSCRRPSRGLSSRRRPSGPLTGYPCRCRRRLLLHTQTTQRSPPARRRPPARNRPTAAAGGRRSRPAARHQRQRCCCCRGPRKRGCR